MSDQSKAQAPAPAAPAWEPPSADSEFVFKDVASAPAWVDKSWGSFDNGPALAVPTMAFPAKGREPAAGTGHIPYDTVKARIGDTVKWVNAKRRFEVVRVDEAPKDEDLKAAHMVKPGDEGTLKPVMEEVKPAAEKEDKGPAAPSPAPAPPNRK